jgi:hypothetical protein
MLEQTEEHVVMVGSWPCKVSLEIHINRRRVSEPVREDKGKTTASEPEDRKDLKRERVVLSKGHSITRAGLTGLAKTATQTGKQIGLARLPGLAQIAARINGHIRLAVLIGLATRSIKRRF